MADGIAYDTCSHCKETIFTRTGKFYGKYWYHESFHGLRICDLPPHKVLFKKFYYRATPSKKRALTHLTDATPRVGR
jgi:hypothetical protein